MADRFAQTSMLDALPLTVEQRILVEDYTAGRNLDADTTTALDHGAVLGIRLGGVILDTTNRLTALAEANGHDPRPDLDLLAGCLESFARTIRDTDGTKR